MEKKYEAIFSIKMGERVGEGFNSDTHIEGGANDILNCLKIGLKQLHRGGVSKSILHEVVDTACVESKENEQLDKDLATALEDAPEEVKEAVRMLKAIGII